MPWLQRAWAQPELGRPNKIANSDNFSEFGSGYPRSGVRAGDVQLANINGILIMIRPKRTIERLLILMGVLRRIERSRMRMAVPVVRMPMSVIGVTSKVKMRQGIVPLLSLTCHPCMSMGRRRQLAGEESDDGKNGKATRQAEVSLKWCYQATGKGSFNDYDTAESRNNL
jgi:hypothetical protein